MKAKFSPVVLRAIIQFSKNDKKLIEKIHKQISIFEVYPTHPSLRLHKLSGSLHNTWSISITMRIRMLYYVRDGVAYFFSIGTHDEVYKK